MKYNEFKKLVALSREEICREIFEENRDRIKVKKRDLAVRNLVKIFDAALAISNKKGFHAMSLRDLSRETGLSMGALYSYFESKEELLDIIQAQGRRISGKVLVEQVERGREPEERLRQAVFCHLYLSEALFPWFYFSYMEARHLDREHQNRAIESELFTEKIFKDILDDGFRKGVFMAADTQLAAAVIKAMLQDWYLKRWKYSRRRVSVEEYARFILGIIESFILVPVEAAPAKTGETLHAR
jgi:AcrR family transcriptional regulator